MLIHAPCASSKKGRRVRYIYGLSCCDATELEYVRRQDEGGSTQQKSPAVEKDKR